MLEKFALSQGKNGMVSTTDISPNDFDNAFDKNGAEDDHEGILK